MNSEGQEVRARITRMKYKKKIGGENYDGLQKGLKANCIFAKCKTSFAFGLRETQREIVTETNCQIHEIMP